MSVHAPARLRRALRIQLLAASMAATLASAVAHADPPQPTRIGMPTWEPGDARVPPPKPFDPLAPTVVGERWRPGPRGEFPSLYFPVDLDCLAPLGMGSGNAARWLGQFADDGPRAAERDIALKRKVTVTVYGASWGAVLPGDDPLLLEAEPWMDQGTCMFFPDVWRFDAGAPLPPGLFAMMLGRSWIARGARSPDPAAAQEDFRRAARLGRLLLQDDLFVVQDLIGRQLLRQAVEALGESARQQGDLATIVATERTLRALEEHRTLARARTEHFQLSWHDAATDRTPLRLDDRTMESLVLMAERDPHRRFRILALRTLNCVRGGGTRAQRRTAEEVLARAAAHPSPFIAVTAAWALSAPPCTDEAENDPRWDQSGMPPATRARIRAQQ